MGNTVTFLVSAAERGDSGAVQELFAALYSELHRRARIELSRNNGQVSISPTTILHEAYLDMAERESACFPDRGRFMAYAARVMRGIVIDHARSRRALKRGGQLEITSADTNVFDQAADAEELSAISDALEELAVADRELAELVDLKFFCGFSFAEIAVMRGVSERTVQRGWEKARIFLHRSMRAEL